MTISRGGDYRTDRPISIGEADKVQSWPFKEPEKTTAWKDSELAEAERAMLRTAGMPMRDPELEKAKRRTAELKKLMSPAGVLGLPELLDEARLKWGIPDAAFDARAVFDRIHIFPIDAEGVGKETYGTSSIHRPESAKMRDLQNGHRGILISMGLTAADHCVSHGIELGHIVRTIRNAPHVQECARLVEGGPMHFLVMRDGDLTGDETLELELRLGKRRIVDVGGEHSYAFEIDGKKKQVALTKDNW